MTQWDKVTLSPETGPPVSASCRSAAQPKTCTTRFPTKKKVMWFVLDKVSVRGENSE